MPIQYTISDTDSRFLKPTGSGNIDIVKDMAWTLSPKSSRTDVPFINLTEYQQTTGQLIAAIVYYSRVVSNVSRDGFINTMKDRDDVFDVYKYKYFAEPTGFRYKIPYFNPKKTARGNSFGAANNPFEGVINFGQSMRTSSIIGNRGSGVFGLLGEGAAWGQSIVALGNTIVPGGINFEFPSSWDATELETIEVTFDLFNTTSLADVEANRNFCHLFSYQNSPSRRNFAIVDPPAIYSLEIPDVALFPACYVTSLNITNLGNTRLMALSDGITRTIPEAYRIAVVFKSLLMPTRNIMGAMDKGSTVEAISDVTPFQEIMDRTFDSWQNESDPNFVGPQNPNILGNAVSDVQQQFN